MNETGKLKRFTDQMTALTTRGGDDPTLIEGARELMKALVGADDWLSDEMAQPHPSHYRQYLLYRDPDERFVVVSFVWGPGQHAPVHDHTVWGVIGMLRGAERTLSYDFQNGHLLRGTEARLEPGDVEAVGPGIGDIHQVSNAYEDRVSISIHCYGADIGRVRRHVYDPDSAAVKEFVSGYANTASHT
ncbi:cysteine dioxygenase [Paraburkholderia sp. CI3]|uniref:cysteine dioxygenase family protein n=1 Tax=Paraburkholderia sp. CI3 TaxID=2991060 RepID=UPI003D1DD0B5